MSCDPKLTLTIYILTAVIFVSVITFMVVYNIRLKTRKRTQELMGRPPASKEEGIAIATQEKERSSR